MSEAKPPANEPFAYGIGSDHWPGVGKTIEEMAELAVELGKLQGSGGDRNHWTGDLVLKIRNEIADVRASLRFLEEANPEISHDGGVLHMDRRTQWKLDLFRAWHRNAPRSEWPQPESYGLPSREKQG